MDPDGERRADLRAARMTAHMMLGHGHIKPEDFASLVRGLIQYLPTREDFDDADDLRAAQVLLQKLEG